MRLVNGSPETEQKSVSASEMPPFRCILNEKKGFTLQSAAKTSLLPCEHGMAVLQGCSEQRWCLGETRQCQS